MIVALSTLDAHAHEDLGHVLSHFESIGLVLIVIRGRVLERAALSRKQLLHHLVHRHILGDLVLEPVVIEQRRFVADLIGGADLQQLGPLHDPQLGELFAAQQFID